MIHFGPIATFLAGPILLAAGLLVGAAPAFAQAPCVQWDRAKDSTQSRRMDITSS